MPRLRNSLLAVCVAAICLAQNSSQLLTPEIQRVGMHLACLCGTCNNTVGDCPMLECHYSKPAREKIGAMEAAGNPDKAILDSFVQDQGLRALAAPPTSGFNWLAWLMPWAAVALGLMAIWLWIRRFSSKRAAATAPQIDPAVLARYKDNIEKDLEKFD